MKAFPFAEVIGRDGALPIVEQTATGWSIRCATGLRLELKGFRDGLPCRLESGADREVVQLACGPASSLLCNALYSPSKDLALRFQGDELSIEPSLMAAGKPRGFAVNAHGPVTVAVYENYLRLHRGLPWYEPLNRKVFPRPPAGWCSWYEYYLGITEEEIKKNTDWLAEKLAPFGCEWVQIDDGWQGRGEGYGTNRDWFVTAAKFPNGMKRLAEYIRGKGLRPGLWLIPQTQSDEALFKKQPGLFVRRSDGSSVGEREKALDYQWMKDDADRKVEWAGRYFIDSTSAPAADYLRRLAGMVCNEWGYEYLKIDGQGMMPGLYQRHRRQLEDPASDGDRAYRLLLAPIKEVMGPQRFLLNCGAGWPSSGFCEGIRIGGDVDARRGLDGLRPAVTSTMRWLFLNTIAFYTDPDVVCVRPVLSLELARLWASFLGVTGQLLMAGDKMYVLPEERVELLRRIFPVADIRPMELYPLDDRAMPGIFDLKIRKPGVGDWDVAALFNWDEKEAKPFALWPERLGLDCKAWLGVDAWSGELLHSGEGKLELTLPPAACRVVSVWKQAQHPQLVGTSRHLTQGALDLLSVAWDGDASRLSGTSEVVGGDLYRLRFHLPKGFRLNEPPAGWSITKTPASGEGLAEATLKPERSRKERWAFAFKVG